MTKRKHIQIKKDTYNELKKRRKYDKEALTNVLLRLIDKYGGFI